jgi:hypothetical protein
MNKIHMTLDQCRALAVEVLERHGCDGPNAAAIAETEYRSDHFIACWHADKVLGGTA